jgi:RND superfamily putative drug exporter
MSERRSIFARPATSRAKWVVFAVWLVGIFIAAGPANLPGKFTDAEDNESTSFLPGDAESTKALQAAEELQGGELAPAVIVYRRESGLTQADRDKIVDDVRRLTERRFPGVVPDGATAAAGGEDGGSQQGPAGGTGEAPAGGGTQAEGCGSPTTPIPGQPSDYAPFVGPICSPDGKAAIVTAYLKGEGDGDRILDPIEFWRDTVSDPGGGLEVKITGGAGYAADAIEVFESINGTLLLAAVSLVIFLLILIYRSPIFLFIPLAAIMFAEVLARSIGYGLSELGVTINGQSSAIMSIMVLGAGTDYALLIVARYRDDLRWSGGVRLGRDGDRRAPLPLDREGQRHVGHGPDRRDGRGLRRPLDAHSASGPAHDLRPARLLAVRAAHSELEPGRRDAHDVARPPDR